MFVIQYKNNDINIKVGECKESILNLAVEYTIFEYTRH